MDRMGGVERALQESPSWLLILSHHCGLTSSSSLCLLLLLLPRTRKITVPSQISTLIMTDNYTDGTRGREGGFVSAGSDEILQAE